MNYCKNILPIVLFGVNFCFATTVQSPTLYGKEDLINFFNRNDKLINNGDGFKYSTNDSGYLAWRESYIMMSYNVMYRATKEVFYLLKLIDHADAVLNNRNDVQGFVDYRGISSAGWRSKKYTSTEEETYYYSFIVHSGMITFPMVDFANIVFYDSTLWPMRANDGRMLIDKAKEYLHRVEETILYHDDQWVNGPAENEGHYIYRPDAYFLRHLKFYDPGKNLPFNQQNALGSVLVVLYKLTGNIVYYDKAYRLANFFKSRLKLFDNNSYVWNYWVNPKITDYTGHGEDISHASINIIFAVLAFHNSIVFDMVDMERFANTFTKNISQSDSSLFDWVSGEYYEGNCKLPKSFPRNNYLCQSGRWLDLAEFDHSVFTTVMKVYHHQNYFMKGIVGPILGIANLILWFDRLSSSILISE